MTLKNFLSRNSFLILLILPGLFFALIRCCYRISIEKSDHFVEIAVDFEETRKLARQEGADFPETLLRFSKAGVSSIGISEDTLSSLADEGRITVYTYQDILRLKNQSIFPPRIFEFFSANPGSLLVCSAETDLLFRIKFILSQKNYGTQTEIPYPNGLLIRRSGPEFFEKVGLGFSDKWIKLARESGLGIILRPQNYPDLHSESIEALFQKFPSFEGISAILFADEEAIGSRGDLKTAAECLIKKSEGLNTRIGRVEFNDQEGIPELIPLLNDRITIVRTHSIGRKELDEVYDVPRATARWIRAVRERQMKLLYVRFFQADLKKLRGDLLKYNLDYISGISNELKNWGFKFPRTDFERKIEPRQNIGGLYWFEDLSIGISLFAGLPILVALLFSIPIGSLKLFFFLLPVIIGFLFLNKGLFIGLFALIGAVSWSTLGCIWSINRLETIIKNSSEGLSLWQTLVFSLILALPSVLGGILIAGFHTESLFLLHYEQFRGIKIAFVLPILLIAYYSFRKYGSGIFSILNQPLTIKTAGISVLLFLVASLYLLRSGNISFIKGAIPFEDTIRTWLEDSFIARPRNKEFLIGYPAAVFFVFARSFGFTGLLPLLAIFMEMGQVSVVNTFCHFHSPLIIGFIRTIHGYWIGLSLGLAIIFLSGVYFAIRAGFHKKNSGVLLGYFGFDNLGDELLWMSFVRQASTTLPEIKWSIITKKALEIHNQLEVIPILRKDIIKLLQAIASAKVLVIPGGGVLQSSTSRRSLIYYVLILWLGKLFGTKIMLIGQGLGPWQNPEKNNILSTLAGFSASYLVGNVEHFTVRDQISLKFLEELAGEFKVPVTTDLTFLCPPPASELPSPDGGFQHLRLGVVIRSSNQSSEKILSEILQVQEVFHNLEVVPIVFQLSEDEKIWESSNLAQKTIILNSLEQAKETFQSLDLIVTMRLHGCILATIVGLPWIGISHDPKIKGIADEMKWPFVYSPETFTRYILINNFPGIVEKKKSLREVLLSFAALKREVALEDVKNCLAKIPVNIEKM
ncbi:MAG: polysaccharide pyruvyl transferase family protein [Candidatus Riflebacteria bacterium]|nr:polysaccharide pyruvyl transferase family protein [Candidatus Riflebacteria bacterium]